jgi:hypothetical protein
MFEGSDGYLYASTAGHVALGLKSGERTWPEGTGAVAFDLEGNRVGEFVYAINTRSGSHPELPPGADVSLIRVDGTGDVERAVCQFGGPTGTDDRVIAPPEIVELRWFGATVVGGRIGHPIPGVNQWLVPGRTGVSIGLPSPQTVSVFGHAAPGDSGAPVLGVGGGAIGWISGPPTSPEEISQGGLFVVSRVTPAIERAGQMLGITLTLATA